MKFFSKKPDNLEKLLKSSQQDFRFDQEKVKNRLMYSLESAPIKAPAKTFATMRVIRYAAVCAVLLISISTTFAFASSAQPGDKLFALNKWGEKIILSLPLSVGQRAKIETKIVGNRLKALEAVQTAPETRQVETVKEADTALENAIETVSENKKKMETEQDPANTAILNQALSQLDDLAKLHEQQVQMLEKMIQDHENHAQILLHLHEIKNARHKARLELNLNDAEDDSN